MRAMVRTALLSSLALVACAGDKEPAPAAQPAAAAETPKKKSNVKTFTSPVPLGKQVACADLVDGAAFATYLGGEIKEVVDRNKSNREATAACAFIKGGTPPSTRQQERQFSKDMKLGVLPGDEICTVTALCSYPVDLEDFKKKCEAQGNQESQALGQFACVRQTQRADQYAYTYRMIDAETQCIFEVMGGPSVTDETIVQLCSKAALETITPEAIKKFQ